MNLTLLVWCELVCTHCDFPHVQNAYTHAVSCETARRQYTAYTWLSHMPQIADSGQHHAYAKPQPEMINCAQMTMAEHVTTALCR